MDCESIMTTEFKRLTEIDKSDIMELINHPLVRRHLPLASGRFEESDCEDFVAAKEEMWKRAGYGPWAFVVDGRFVGWGGLQPEDGIIGGWGGCCIGKSFVEALEKWASRRSRCCYRPRGSGSRACGG
jgi:hypothetical protein